MCVPVTLPGRSAGRHRAAVRLPARPGSARLRRGRAHPHRHGARQHPARTLPLELPQGPRRHTTTARSADRLRPIRTRRTVRNRRRPHHHRPRHPPPARRRLPLHPRPPTPPTHLRPRTRAHAHHARPTHPPPHTPHPPPPPTHT